MSIGVEELYGCFTKSDKEVGRRISLLRRISRADQSGGLMGGIVPRGKKQREVYSLKAKCTSTWKNVNQRALE